MLMIPEKFTRDPTRFESYKNCIVLFFVDPLPPFFLNTLAPIDLPCLQTIGTGNLADPPIFSDVYLPLLEASIVLY